MGKKNRKKTTWRRLSLNDESTAGESMEDCKDSTARSTDTDTCSCNNSRNARLHSMSVKKSFLSSRKYRQYPPAYHATDFSSGLIGSVADDCSTTNSYTASEENVYGDEQQQPVYFQPFVYPCFITPTLLLPPYHPSQWYEDPRLPYDPQNFICLTQPLSPHPPPHNSSSINSCSSPETGSDVGYSSSSPPVTACTARSSIGGGSGEEEPAPPAPMNYGDGVTADDAYFPHQPYLHQVAGVLPDDQQSPSSPPYFYSGTTYVLKPLAVVRHPPPPPPECWWDNDYGGGGGGVGRRRRRRGFIGGEGITYDRWPSRITKDPQKTQEPLDNMQEDVVDEPQDNPIERSHKPQDNPLERSHKPQDNPIERSHNKEYSSSPVRDEVMAVEEPQVQECSGNDVSEDSNGQNEAEIESKVESDDKQPVEDECNEEATPSTSLPSSLPAISATPTDTWSTACQDPLRYSKYYQICGVDDEEMADEDEEEEEKVEATDAERVSAVELMPCVDEIVVHEIGSSNDASECGSEDVEMLGHRYESGAEKLYKPNPLSLAAELLGSNQPLPYDHHLRPLMERSKRITLTSTTGYLSNTRHVMESYCSHLAVRHQAAAKMGVVCDGNGRPEAVRPRSDGLDDDDIDVADAADEEIIFRRSSTEANVFQPQSVSGRRYGFSPFMYLRNKGPWHGCCCSIM